MTTAGGRGQAGLWLSWRRVRTAALFSISPRRLLGLPTAIRSPGGRSVPRWESVGPRAAQAARRPYNAAFTLLSITE